MTNSSRKRWHRFRSLARWIQQRYLLPTPRLMLAVAVAAPVAGAGYALHYGQAVLLVMGTGLLIASAADIWLLPRRGSLHLRRELPGFVDMSKSFSILLHLQAQEVVHLHYELADDVPQSFQLDGSLVQKGVWKGRKTQVSYSVTPKERGLYELDVIRVRYWGGIGLWAKQWRVSLPQQMKVYPDMTNVRGVLGSLQDSLVLDGRRITRRERSGSEFHSIREHVIDDDPRHINWTASARARTMMTNVYRPERGKLVTLLIDCGRMMGVELKEQSKLDLSLEAALALAAVALKQGDQVSLLAFSNRIQTFVPPGSGLLHLQTLIDATYHLKSEFVESSYGMALQYLMKVQKKHGLTVLFSDMDNYLYEDQLLPYLLRLKRSHRLLLLALRDELLHGWAQLRIRGQRDAFASSIAQQFTLERKSYVAQMAAHGIDVVDVPVGQLALTAVNRYLDMRARDAL